MTLEPGQVFPIKGQSHAEYMEMALKQATKAFERDEIPIGAVVVKNGTIIADDIVTHNSVINVIERFSSP